MQDFHLLAGRAAIGRGISSKVCRQHRSRTVVTEFGPVADAGHTPRAHGVEILLMQREVAITEHAVRLPVLAWGAAGGTSNHRGVVCLGLGYFEVHSTKASKMVMGLQRRCVELPLAVRTCHQ